jgi:hypothetical protein
MPERTLSVLVDQEPIGIAARSSVEHLIRSKLPNMIELEVASLADELKHRINDVTTILNNLTEEEDGAFELQTVSFTMAITASGKVSLVSTLEGSISPQVGFQFSFSRKRS